MSGAVIAGIRLTPTHDGEAALVVELRFAGGGRSRVQIDADAARAVMAKAQVASAIELIGLPWTVLDVRTPGFAGTLDRRQER